MDEPKELVRNKSFASSETSHSTTPGFKLGTVADAEEVLGAPEAVESKPCWSKLTDALLQYLGNPGSVGEAIDTFAIPQDAAHGRRLC
eukprot:s5801_g1.t1